jgi:hypothetical protein
VTNWTQATKWICGHDQVGEFGKGKHGAHSTFVSWIGSRMSQRISKMNEWMRKRQILETPHGEDRRSKIRTEAWASAPESRIDRERRFLEMMIWPDHRNDKPSCRSNSSIVGFRSVQGNEGTRWLWSSSFCWVFHGLSFKKGEEKDVRLWKEEQHMGLWEVVVIWAGLFQGNFLRKIVTSFLTCQMCCDSDLRVIHVYSFFLFCDCFIILRFHWGWSQHCHFPVVKDQSAQVVENTVDEDTDRNVKGNYSAFSLRITWACTVR